MNICLVVPEYGPNMVNDPCCYPLGFMYVSSYYKSLGHNVKVLNFNVLNYSIRDEFNGMDLIALTGFEQFREINAWINDIAHFMGIKTVIGGGLATFCYQDMKPLYDEVVVGEIEQDMPIDDIPWPDYEAFGINEYNKIHSFPYIGVLTSRGCPFKCSFCAHTCRYRERNLKDVGNEIDNYIRKYGIELLIFNDNTLNVTKKRFMSICEMMQSKHIGWSAAIRVDVFDEEMAIKAKNSGCQYFVVGIESFRQDRLDKMNKHIKTEDITRTLDLLHKHDLSYHGNIILGLDDETIEDITQEIEEMPSNYNVYPVLAQPFIGTDVRSSLTTEERTILNSIFSTYVENHGLNVYEGLN